jgi:hypothetical protein
LIIRQTSPEDIAGWFDVFDQRHEVICIPLPDLGSSTASEQQLRDLINRFYALDSAMGGRVALVIPCQGNPYERFTLSSNNSPEFGRPLARGDLKTQKLPDRSQSSKQSAVEVAAINVDQTSTGPLRSFADYTFAEGDFGRAVDLITDHYHRVIPAFLETYEIGLSKLPLMLIFVRGYSHCLELPLPKQDLFEYLLPFLDGLRKEVERDGDFNVANFAEPLVLSEARRYNDQVRQAQRRLEKHKAQIPGAFILLDSKYHFSEGLNEGIRRLLQSPNREAFSNIIPNLSDAGVTRGQLNDLRHRIEAYEVLQDKVDSVEIPSLDYESLERTIERGAERMRRIDNYISEQRALGIIHRGVERATSFQARIRPLLEMLASVAKRVGSLKGIPPLLSD